MTQRDSNPWPLRCRCSALTNWATKSHRWELSWLEHCTDITEVMGLNPVESPQFLVDCNSVHQVGESLCNNYLRRRRNDILYVGESTPDVGEQGVGETTVIQHFFQRSLILTIMIKISYTRKHNIIFWNANWSFCSIEGWQTKEVHK